MKYEVPCFESEAALCQAFILSLPAEWVAYPETAGWDILLVHRSGGWQIGIEAKLSLNAKVLAQAIKGDRFGIGPDFRAVLVGKIVAENATLAAALGLTVIAPRGMRPQHEWEFHKAKRGPYLPEFAPELPRSEQLDRIGEWWSTWDREAWFDRFPSCRETLPEYVPEVAAGVPSPIVLSDWKIKAMRVCVWVERQGSITRAQFRALGIDPSRWMTGHWLKAGSGRGEWLAGPGFPASSLRRDHPGIYAKVEADFEKWSETVRGKAA